MILFSLMVLIDSCTCAPSMYLCCLSYRFSPRDDRLGVILTCDLVTHEGTSGFWASCCFNTDKIKVFSDPRPSHLQCSPVIYWRRVGLRRLVRLEGDSMRTPVATSNQPTGLIITVLVGRAPVEIEVN